MSDESRQNQTARIQHKPHLAALRRQAQQQLTPPAEPVAPLAKEDVEGLLYELQVHQIELEMQCKQLQDSQRETEDSRNSYRELYDSMPIGYATIDASGRICDLNPAGALILGLGPVPRMPNFHVFIATKDLDRFDLTCREVFAKNRPRTSEFTLERADGASLCAEVGMYPVQAGVALSKLRLTFQDVSPKRKAEETVKQQQIQLEQNRKELQLLTTGLVNARQQERRRMAEELRGNYCQRLATYIREMQLMSPECDGRQRKRMEEISARLVQLLEDLGHFAQEPHAFDAEKLSLSRGIRRYIADLSASTGLSIEFKELNVPTDLPQPLAQYVYRLMQASLDNVVKHAQATQALITLIGSDSGIELRVVDDGRGFDLTQVLQSKKGMGLMSIQERVRQLEGKVIIQSRPGQGAELKVKIPMTAVAARALPIAS
jgi:PAS domain S-box-containing protein